MPLFYITSLYFRFSSLTIYNNSITVVSIKLEDRMQWIKKRCFVALFGVEQKKRKEPPVFWLSEKIYLCVGKHTCTRAHTAAFLVYVKRCTSCRPEMDCGVLRQTVRTNRTRKAVSYHACFTQGHVERCRRRIRAALPASSCHRRPALLARYLQLGHH